VWWKILFYHIPQFIYASKSERIIEIGQSYRKNKSGTIFYGPRCILGASRGLLCDSSAVLFIYMLQNNILRKCILIVHNILTLLHKYINKVCYKCVQYQMHSCFSICIFRISGLHFTTLPILIYLYIVAVICGASSHVVCSFDQSASFRIFDSAFYFPHSAIPHFTFAF